MKAIAAKEAKNNFGAMLDSVQREPIAIEKHGRAVAVVMSAEDYRQMKLEQLRAKLAVGKDQLDRGEFSKKTVEEMIAEAKQRRHEKQKI